MSENFKVVWNRYWDDSEDHWINDNYNKEKKTYLEKTNKDLISNENNPQYEILRKRMILESIVKSNSGKKESSVKSIQEFIESDEDTKTFFKNADINPENVKNVLNQHEIRSNSLKISYAINRFRIKKWKKVLLFTLLFYILTTVIVYINGNRFEDSLYVIAQQFKLFDYYFGWTALKGILYFAYGLFVFLKYVNVLNEKMKNIFMKYQLVIEVFILTLFSFLIVYGILNGIPARWFDPTLVLLFQIYTTVLLMLELVLFYSIIKITDIHSMNANQALFIYSYKLDIATNYFDGENILITPSIFSLLIDALSKNLRRDQNLVIGNPDSLVNSFTRKLFLKKIPTSGDIFHIIDNPEYNYFFEPLFEKENYINPANKNKAIIEILRQIESFEKEETDKISFVFQPYTFIDEIKNKIKYIIPLITAFASALPKIISIL